MSKQKNKFTARLSPSQRNALKEVREEELERVNGGAGGGTAQAQAPVACW